MMTTSVWGIIIGVDCQYAKKCVILQKEKIKGNEVEAE